MKKFITPTLINEYVLEMEPKFCKYAHQLTGIQVEDYGNGYMLYLYAKCCNESKFHFTDYKIELVSGDYPLATSDDTFQRFMASHCGPNYTDGLYENENVRHQKEILRIDRIKSFGQDPDKTL